MSIMWKRVMVACLAILGTVYICTAYYNSKINATQNSYQAGGRVSGRVNIPPSGINNYQIGMKKGDKFMMGINNPYYTDEPLSFQLIEQKTYTDYGCVVDVGSDPTYPDGYINHTTTCNNPSVTAWLTGSTRIVDKMVLGQTPAYYIQFYPVPEMIAMTYVKEDGLYQSIASLYQSLTQKDKDHIKEFNLSNLRAGIANAGGINTYYGNARIMRSIFFSNHAELYQKIVPLISEAEATNSSGSDILEADLRLDENYYYGGSYSYHGTMWQATISPSYTYNNPALLGTTPAGIRPFLYYDTDDVVFAVSKGTDIGIADIEQPEVTSGYTALYQEGGEPMKLRVHQPVLDSTIRLMHIENANEDTITKTVKDHTIYLKATAQSGADSDGNPYTVSVLVFDADGNFVYYQPLEQAKGSGTYAFDLTDIPIGKYKIGIVNEAYNENSTAPADCSLISDTLELEIVKPHQISYTKAPQSGASAGNDYEYSKNVDGGDIVGKITLNPTGVTPITYAIETYGDQTYQNFEIDGLDSNNASSATSLNIKIKQNANDLDNGTLKAGTYKFCITSTDANGYPVTQIDNKTKVCTSLDVKKTNLTVAFNNQNLTKKTITEAETNWTEIAAATPSHGTKITYSKVGGDIGLIDINGSTGEITYRGNHAFGKVKIRATADDDPNSGNDNYNSAYVEKEIVIVREVDATITPDPASSDTTIPTFAASDANVRSGGTIGKIQGTLGTPDTIGGTVTTYTYAIKSDSTDHSSLFQVNASTGVIKTNANLDVDTYHFTIIVSDRWSNKEIPVTIHVGLAPAENLKFYENSTSGVVINTKSAR